MSKSPVSLETIVLPNFGRASFCPELPVEVFRRRIARTLDRMRDLRLDFLIVYADREHLANLAYLTGFDPRFEEALLLIDGEGRLKLLVGNECLGYLPDSKGLGLEIELFQEFSLMGQPRDRSQPLRRILRDFGIRRDGRIGCAGWKYFDGRLIKGGAFALDVPAYLADALRELAGGTSRVINAAGLFMDPQDGLRVTNEAAQIAQFEFAAGMTSHGVLQLLKHLRPGVRECDLEKYLDSGGLPLNCHRMIGFGEKARRGLASPSARRARLGDAYTTALGVQGALTSRAGVIARSTRDLPESLRDFYPGFVSHYFEVVAAWYEAVAVGVKASRIARAVESVRDPSLFRLALNPGHYLHLDEWLHSPFSADSPVLLRSGMVLQMDIIPVSEGPFCYANAEDGVALADGKLRAELTREFPEMWERISARRQFMEDQLGLRLDASVLPLGNTSGWLPPYAMNLKAILCKSPSR